MEEPSLSSFSLLFSSSGIPAQQDKMKFYLLFVRHPLVADTLDNFGKLQHQNGRSVVWEVDRHPE